MWYSRKQSKIVHIWVSDIGSVPLDKLLNFMGLLLLHLQNEKVLISLYNIKSYFYYEIKKKKKKLFQLGIAIKTWKGGRN